MSSVVRWSDLLCEPCQQEIVEGACTIDLRPAYMGELKFADAFRCPPCREAFARDASAITLQPDLTCDQVEELSALHEAAHAALVLAIGGSLLSVRLFRKPVHRATNSNTAETTYFPPDNCRLIDTLAVFWAGQQAELGRLNELGLANPANCVDVRVQGWHDISLALDEIRTTAPDLDPMATLLDSRQHADALLAEHWTTVLSLQRDLLKHRDLFYDPPLAITQCEVPA